jgi:aldehyde dehydrogenase (NAD+)
VPRTHQDALVAAFQKAYDSFWPHPKGPLDEKSELAHIIYSRAQTRLQNLISDTRGTIVMGGRYEGKRIEPTIVKDVKLDDVLMDAWV